MTDPKSKELAGSGNGPEKSRLQGAQQRPNPFSLRYFDVDWSKMKITFPVRAMLTEDDKVYIEVHGNGPGYPFPTTLWVKLIGPIDPEGDVEKQLEGVGIWMAVHQTREEICQELAKINALKKVFFSTVDLNDFKSNFREAVAAMKTRDIKAFNRLCPDSTQKSA